ncbi:MAG: hypothetical protein H6858_04075 [Rhodospirillales bacterium]|nr:hypothetical protein [Alphaproteobacteria bacterium]MCB9976764.1 hypothetical protein [Rhodospirillales bacterium]
MTRMSVTKELSANDTGETGGHQAGILVPKQKELLSFFPPLDARQYNPRVHIMFEDTAKERWEFAFIYYNNRNFGGTRNEYRLTRMTRYIREAGLVEGDSILLSRAEDGKYAITYKRKSEPHKDVGNVLKLRSGWRIIKI